MLNADVEAREPVHPRGSDPLGAIQDALDAGDTDAALGLLARRWVELLAGPDAAALARIGASLPGGLSEAPRILLMRACAHDVLGEHAVARTLLARATASIDEGNAAETRTTLLLARLILTDDRAEAIAASDAVRAELGRPEAIEGPDLAAVLYLIGWVELRHRSRPQLIVDYLAGAAREASATGNVALQARAEGHLAFALAWSGRMRAAHDVLARHDGGAERDDAPWASYAGSGAGSASGYLALWEGDPRSAYRDFARVIDEGGSSTAFGGTARMFLAVAAAIGRDADACRRAVIEVHAIPHDVAHALSWPAFRDAAIASLDEAAGRRERAVAVARRWTDASDIPFAALVFAGILRRAGDPAAALTLIEQHSRYLGVSYVSVSLRATAALVRKRHGDVALAHELLESALDAAVTESIRLPFCDGDLDMRHLLTAHLTRGTRHADFIASCLVPPGRSGVLDSLSEREAGVFRLLQTDRTMAEIAEALGLSVNTVKTHQRSIYRKLGVNSRREAQRVAI